VIISQIKEVNSRTISPSFIDVPMEEHDHDKGSEVTAELKADIQAEGDQKMEAEGEAQE
jgi:hypothetical protein